MKTLLTFLTCVLLGSPPGAVGFLRGTVTDATTGAPLLGVVVLIEGGEAARTDSDGTFVLALQPGGPYVLRALHNGYSPLVSSGNGSQPAAGHLSLALHPSHLRLHDTVVVSAHREAVPSIDVPWSVSTVESKALEERMPRSVPDALADVGGLYVQKTNQGAGSPYLRGLVGNHVLALVDGVRLNNATYRYGPNQYLATVDPYSVERIEVIRGPGSVLHGSDALGGVVNVLTRIPEFSERLDAKGQMSSKLASGGAETSGRATGQISKSWAAVSAGATWRRFGDIRAGGELGVQAPSGYRERAADLRSSFRLSPSTTVTGAFDYLRQGAVPRFDQVRQRGFSRWVFDPQIRRMAYARLTSFPAGKVVRSLRATISHNHSFERRVRQAQGSPVEIRERDIVDALGLSAELRSRPLPKLSLIWGAEHFRDQVGSTRTDLNLDTGVSLGRRGLYPDQAHARASATFVSGLFDAGRLTLHAGGRINHHRVAAPDPLFSVNTRSTAFVGHAAMNLRFGANRVFASTSSGFRAPNIDDVSTLGPFDFGIETPSPNLRPERSLGFDLGFKTRTRRLGASVSVYRTSLRDLIDRLPSTFQGSEFYEGQRVYQRANLGRAFVRGVEAEAGWLVGSDISVFAAFTSTYGQQTSADQPLRRIPPLQGQVGARWRREARGVTATLHFAGRQDRLAPGDKADHRINPNGTSGYALLSLQGAWALRPAVHLTGGVENLFDEPYRTHGSGIDGPGRHVWIGIRLGR